MKKVNTSLTAALLTGVIALICFMPVIVGNDSIFILYGDSVEQQYAFIMGFWQKIHELDFHFYEWSNGFGASTFSYIFYNLFSPFNLLYLPFPKEMIKHLMLIINILKLMILAFFSCLWLKKTIGNSEVALAGSLMVVFSGWVLFYYHYQFLDAFVFYPLILYFTEQYLQNEKKWGLVLSVATLTFVNYYFMYMFVPFLWLYALFRYLILHEGARLSHVLKDGGIFLILSLLGMGLSGVVLLPCLNFILNSPRLTTNQQLTWFIGIKDLYKIATSLLTPVFSRIEPSHFISQNHLTYQGWGGGASLYTSIFVFVLVPYVFCLENKYKRNLLIGFLAVVCFFILCPFFYKLFQGSIDTRFFYMFTLLITLICCEVLCNHHMMSKKNNILLSFLTIAFFACALFVSWKWSLSNEDALYSLCLVQFILFLLLFVGQLLFFKMGIKFWLICLCFESAMSLGIFIHWNEPIDSTDFLYETEVNEIIENIKSQDDGFYRVLFDSSSHRLANDAYINQISGVSFYSSIYGYEQEDFLERIKSRWSLPNYTGKYRLYTLTGAKYWMTNKENPSIPVGYEKVENQDYYINTNHVELGYVIDETISSEYVLSLPFVTQDRIMQEYLLIEESDNETYELHDHFSQIVEWAMPEYVEISFDDPISDAIVYIENFGIPIIDVSLYYHGQLVRTESYWQYHYVDIYLSDEEQVDQIIIQGQDVDQTGSAINVYVAEHASETERELFVKRSQESFEHVQFDNDRISAEITLSKQSYVLTQIPYDSGWTVLVDGEKVSPIIGNGGFIALQMEAGSHEVIFMYQMPWMKEGITLSLVSIVLLLVWMVAERRNSFLMKNKSDTIKKNLMM